MFSRWTGRPFFSALLDRLPSQCTVCRAWPAQPLCDGCVARFAAPEPRCRTCAIPLAVGAGPDGPRAIDRSRHASGPGDPGDRGGPRIPGDRRDQCDECRRQPPPLDACHAACAYDWPWPGCIADFKFRGDPGRAGPLAALLRSVPWVEPAVEQAELILPMPLAPARLRERGFNQAYELARRLDPGKADPALLLRTRETPAQSGLGRQDRLRNLEGAFALDPARASAVRGRSILLVDDVMTSGASLFAAAALLRGAGAARVTAVVLARTDAPE